MRLPGALARPIVFACLTAVAGAVALAGTHWHIWPAISGKGSTEMSCPIPAPLGTAFSANPIPPGCNRCSLHCTKAGIAISRQISPTHL